MAAREFEDLQDLKDLEETKVVALGSLVPGSGLWASAQDIPEPQPVSVGVSVLNGALELRERLPQESLRRKYSWIIQKEPEAHLDFLSGELESAMTERHEVVGASFKDKTFLENLEKQDLDHTVVSKPIVAGNDVSLIQREFGSTKLTGLGSTSKPRGVVVRHLLEHVYDLDSFFKALREIVGEGGLILVEVPDTEPALREKDFSEVWDEHVWYFTAESLNATVESFGFSVLRTGKCVSDGEHVLFVIAKMVEQYAPPRPISSELSVLANRYLDALASERLRAAELTSTLNRGLVIYGANHRASNFIDVFLPKEIPISVVDDDPRKQGLRFSSRAVRISAPAECTAPDGTPVLVALNETRVGALFERKPPLLAGATAIGAISNFSFLYKV